MVSCTVESKLQWEGLGTQSLIVPGHAYVFLGLHMICETEHSM